MNINPYFRIKRMSPQFLVADLERAVEFYVKILGFDVDFRYEDFYVGIVKDSSSIHLKLNSPCTEERKSSDNLEVLFTVDGIDDLYKDILNKSAKIIQPLRDMPYGKEFYVADPDGNIIAFVE